MTMTAPRVQAAEESSHTNRVLIKSWLTTASQKEARQVAVNEMITLHIDLATQTWFTAGTRIGKITDPGLMTSQRSLKAVNYTERQQGTTWSHQSWEIPVFVTQSGQYVIQPIPVTVEVSLSPGQNQTATLMTSELRFSASLPSPALTEQRPWFAASKASLDQAWQQSADTLRAGDSIKRQITLKAESTLAALLPNPSQPLFDDAYQTYVSPSELQDSYNRGMYSASRTEQETYVLQGGGEIHFPAIEVQWWDSQNQQLNTLTLEGKTFTVKHTLQSWLKFYAPWLIALLVLLTLALFAFQLAKRYFARHPLPSRYLLWRAVRHQDWAQCRQLIYQRLYEKTQLSTLADFSQDEQWVADTQRLMSEQIDSPLVWSVWRQMTRRAKVQSQYQVLLPLRQLARRYPHP
ncbi:BatD family protein [Photobacterium sp. GJ3]|uniref:BatD family protein n=1 Tax=Photobacterium sp. GJ3 TaxID=2829502 RepID=UPI001B8B2921|nr:BatD family protein [Photobacterium sp. GJ3]QUJ68343.1 BatD family protein [Photobacterium sp. GJ3]